MGYTTYFDGHINVEPPLNEDEISYLRDFAGSRRMKRTGGPYFADPGDDFGQGERDDEILGHNTPPDGQPGLWCHWVSDQSGTAIIWDEGEKFYDSLLWMEYIIEHFLKHGARASEDLDASIRQDKRFENFTFDHECNGTIYADGEDPHDHWKLVVKDNAVEAYEGHIVYEDEIKEAKGA